MIKAVLVFVLLVGAGIFLFFDNVTHFRLDRPDDPDSFNRPYQHIEMGAFGPWLILDLPNLETKRNVVQFRWLTGSMPAGALALLALIALVIIRGLELSSDPNNALETARRAVQTPADGMILAACVSLLAAALMVYLGIDWNAGVPRNPDHPPRSVPPTAAMMFLAAAYALAALAQLTVAIQMRLLRWRTVLLLACFLTLSSQFVFTGAVFADAAGGLKGPALVPFALTGPLTLWATVTLMRQEVRAGFERVAAPMAQE